MKQIHMILQGKGGVGKSFVASLLAQHFIAREITPICIDTDPVNATFASYKAFNVHRIELMKGDNIDHRAFDELVDLVMDAPKDSTFIIDNGAASFVALCAWMVENHVVQFFEESGVNITAHTILIGGQALEDTMVGLDNLLNHFDLPTAVWLNEYEGKPEHNGIAFEDTELFSKHKDKITALIRIPEVRKETFGYDLKKILEQKSTFAEANEDASLSIMTRQRLIMMWRDLDAQMTAANL